MDNNEGVIVAIEGARARISLNRPSKHNALHNEDIARMIEFLEEVDATSQVRSLVVTGLGEKTFCSGAALNQLGQGELDGRNFIKLMDRLESLRIPTICSLNGNVYGGGVEFTLCCDFVLGLIGSRAFVPPARLGLCYGFSGLTRYVNRIGLSAAKRLLVGNETFDAEELLRTGIYDYLVDPADRKERELEIVERLEGLAPLAVQHMKKTLNEIANGTVVEAEAKQREKQCFHSEDLKIGVAAQRDKKKPVFIGE